MGRYYFHLHDDLTVIDEEGLELSGAEAARAKALAMAREMACAEVLDGHLSLKHRIEVADDRGEIVAVVPFGETVEIEA